MRTMTSMRYFNTVAECALSLVGGGGFTAREMAEKCGLKNTPHLRRRLRQLVKGGLLQAVEAYTDSGHMATFYIKPIPKEIQSQEPLPF